MRVLELIIAQLEEVATVVVLKVLHGEQEEADGGGVHVRRVPWKEKYVWVNIKLGLSH